MKLERGLLALPDGLDGAAELELDPADGVTASNTPANITTKPRIPTSGS